MHTFTRAPGSGDRRGGIFARPRLSVCGVYVCFILSITETPCKTICRKLRRVAMGAEQSADAEHRIHDPHASGGCRTLWFLLQYPRGSWDLVVTQGNSLCHLRSSMQPFQTAGLHHGTGRGRVLNQELLARSLHWGLVAWLVGRRKMKIVQMPFRQAPSGP